MFPLEEGFGETWFPNLNDSAKRRFDCMELLDWRALKFRIGQGRGERSFCREPVWIRE